MFVTYTLGLPYPVDIDYLPCHLVKSQVPNRVHKGKQYNIKMTFGVANIVKTGCTTDDCISNHGNFYALISYVSNDSKSRFKVLYF